MNVKNIYSAMLSVVLLMTVLITHLIPEFYLTISGQYFSSSF